MANRVPELGGNAMNTPTDRVKPSDMNDTYTALAEAAIKSQCQIAYAVLQANDVFDNTDIIAVDEFVSAAGTNSTVDTGNSTAGYDATNDWYKLPLTEQGGTNSLSTSTEAGSWADTTNAFDSDDGTYAARDYTGTDSTYDATFGETFSSQYIARVDYKVSMQEDIDTSHAGASAQIQTYDGATWTTVKTHALTLGTDFGEVTVDSSYEVDDTVQGVRVLFEFTNSSNNAVKNARVYTLEYGGYTSSGTVETDTILTPTSAPDAIGVYVDADFPAGTDMTLDVSDDGASTFDITAQARSGKFFMIGTTSLGGTSLALKFNMTGTTSSSPAFRGYSMIITNEG